MANSERGILYVKFQTNPGSQDSGALILGTGGGEKILVEDDDAVFLRDTAIRMSRGGENSYPLVQVNKYLVGQVLAAKQEPR